MKLKNIKKGIKNLILSSLIYGITLGNIGCVSTQKILKEDKNDPEIYLQYLKDGKPELTPFSGSNNINLEGVITGIVINNADSAHINIKESILKSTYSPLQKVEIGGFRENQVMIKHYNSGFSLEKAGIENIKKNLNKNTLTYGVFSSWQGLPFLEKDFDIDFLNKEKIHIDQINPKKIKGYKNISYLGNNKESFEEEHKKTIEDISKSNQTLSNFKNNVEGVIIYENEINNACLYNNKAWLFTKRFEGEGIVSTFEHEFLHNINESYGITSNESLVDYFLSISTEISSEDLKEGYRNMMINNGGYIVFGGLENTGENKDFFEFISETNYATFGGHPYSNSNEFVTSYTHSLFYPEIIKEKIKESNETIKSLYFETGNLILSNLEEGNYKNFIEKQLNYVKSSN